jgi:hypothetical protein
VAIDPCPPVPPLPVTGVVRFDATEFRAMFPGVFDTIADGTLSADFDIATTFVNNSCCSLIKDAAVRQRVLYLATAHIAALLQGVNGQPPSGIVGRVDSAREGSVSVSASYASEMSMSEAYWSQTQYGVMFWQATAQYRAFRYVAPPPQCFGPGISSPGWPWGSGGSCC